MDHLLKSFSLSPLSNPFQANTHTTETEPVAEPIEEMQAEEVASLVPVMEQDVAVEVVAVEAVAVEAVAVEAVPAEVIEPAEPAVVAAPKAEAPEVTDSAEVVAAPEVPESAIADVAEVPETVEKTTNELVDSVAEVAQPEVAKVAVESGYSALTRWAWCKDDLHPNSRLERASMMDHKCF